MNSMIVMVSTSNKQMHSNSQMWGHFCPHNNLDNATRRQYSAVSAN